MSLAKSKQDLAADMNDGLFLVTFPFHPQHSNENHFERYANRTRIETPTRNMTSSLTMAAAWFSSFVCLRNPLLM